MEQKKKIGISLIIIIIFTIIGCGIFLAFKYKPWDKSTQSVQSEAQQKELPLPEITGGDRGKLGIDKNVNEEHIDEYLNRSDAVYRDMRMLDDPGNYEAIGGDSKLSGYVKGFEVVSLPYIIPVTGLPEEVGNTYLGKTLFYQDEDGKYVANYEESLSIIEELFPKDKIIFLMCGGGGYAGMMRQFLISQGWDENKIYNVGGYWYYDGQNNVEVKKIVDGKETYDFESVPYHKIDFDTLTYKVNGKKVNLDSNYYGKTQDNTFDKELDLSMALDIAIKYAERDEEVPYEKTEKGMIESKVNIIKDLIKNEASFVVVVLNTDDACANVSADGFELSSSAKKIMDKNETYCYQINLPIFKKTDFYKTVKYAPSIVVFDKGQISAYTDANVDSFDNDEQVEAWLEKYINFKK